MFKLRNLGVGKKLALLVAIQLVGIVIILALAVVQSRTTHFGSMRRIVES